VKRPKPSTGKDPTKSVEMAKIDAPLICGAGRRAVHRELNSSLSRFSRSTPNPQFPRALIIDDQRMLRRKIVVEYSIARAER